MVSFILHEKINKESQKKVMNKNNGNIGIQTQKENENIKSYFLKIEKEDVEIIFKKLEAIIDDNNLKRNYEILCDILEKDLKVDLNIDYPKLIKDEILFEINDSDELKFIS